MTPEEWTTREHAAGIGSLRSLLCAGLLFAGDREGVKLRAEQRCERCNRWTNQLQVHHLTDERFGNELPEDLAALCFDCHKAQHLKYARRY